jgi:sulfite exporter TauE/SafE
MARGAGRAGQAGGAAPFVLGLVWAFLPCGLLQSALLLAALSPSVGYAALLMGLFAVGSGLSLLLGPWLWGRWARAKTDRWAVRLAGAALLTTSLWALWVALVQGSAPWCLVSPPTGA